MHRAVQSSFRPCTGRCASTLQGACSRSNCGPVPSDIYRNIELLGDIFDRQEQAADLVRRMKETIELVSRKLDGAAGKRMRVLPHGPGPGDDSRDDSFEQLSPLENPQKQAKRGSGRSLLEEWNRLDPQRFTDAGATKPTASAVG